MTPREAQALLDVLSLVTNTPAAKPEAGAGLDERALARAMADQHAKLMPDAKPMSPGLVYAMAADLAGRYAAYAEAASDDIAFLAEGDFDEGAYDRAVLELVRITES